MEQIAVGESRFTESVIHFDVPNDNSRHPDRGGQRALPQIWEAGASYACPSSTSVQY